MIDIIQYNVYLESSHSKNVNAMCKRRWQTYLKYLIVEAVKLKREVCVHRCIYERKPVIYEQRAEK